MDLFEDMKERLGCEYVSDLHSLKEEILTIIETGVLLKYPKQQREDFYRYIFHSQNQKTADILEK